jgi:hypothetical protein
MASLHIGKQFDDLLNQLKTRLGRDKKELVEQSIHYVHKNKIDPQNLKEADISGEVKLLRKDFVGFIKTQEKEKLEPILQKLDYIIEKINKGASPMVNAPNQTSEQYLKLLDTHKSLIEKHNKIVELYNSSIPVLTKQLKENTDSIKQLNEIVETKLSKRILP